MTSFIQLVFLLLLILTAAKLAGYAANLLRQPSVLGELLMGLILGPSLIDALHLPFISDHALSETIHHLAELGVLLLMFVAGLELHLTELLRNTKISAYAGLLGVILPIGLGYGVGLLFDLDSSAALFLGLTLGATSVSISAQTLMELKVLRSRVGLGLLGAAVFDDVLVILFLSIFLALFQGDGGIGAVVWVFVKMLIFLALSVGFGLWVLPKLTHKISHLPISQGILAFALVIMLLYGFAAEVVGGMAAITGAFLAGLMLGRNPAKEHIERGVSALAYGFFVPIFFVNIGLSVNVRELQAEGLLLLLAVTLVAVIGKLFGAGLGARFAGFTWRESTQLGAGMISRGEVGLILASVGRSQNLVMADEFSALVGMVLITTLLTPPFLRALFSPARTPQTPQEKSP